MGQEVQITPWGEGVIVDHQCKNKWGVQVDVGAGGWMEVCGGQSGCGDEGAGGPGRPDCPRHDP